MPLVPAARLDALHRINQQPRKRCGSQSAEFQSPFGHRLVQPVTQHRFQVGEPLLGEVSAEFGIDAGKLHAVLGRHQFTERRNEGRIEEGLQPVRNARLRRKHGLRILNDRTEEHLDEGTEDRFLVAKMGVERRTRHSGCARYVIHCRAPVAVAGEDLERGFQHGRAALVELIEANI